MDQKRMSSLCNRLAFLGALALLVLAVVEKVANWLGYTLIGQSYAPGRLAELAGILLLVVIALLLREIRDQGRAT